jgi:hypothetical protein
MPADVSQFIHMQRLNASQARQPGRGEKTITHLFQPQVLSSGIAEFLPNPKTKFVSGNFVRKYYYHPGIVAKPRLPARNAY